MKNKLKYSFDDEIASKFCYDMDNKKIEVHFTGYSDEKERFLNKPCIFSISNWEEAKSKRGDEGKFSPLDKNIGVFSMILYVEYDGNKLELLVNTIDDRYIVLLFTNPEVDLIISQ
ncbi:hypothetical protein PG275_10235 [Riemerella anatipestifer]|uniref:hypothetical protein n=1 Tax=Riemerella columbina TaxID=103810 RepID=UPI000382C9DC|nr:hypothetical protein [Riemerella columbina]MDY3315927.1 hypothetical protein [Riemerella anatipestifer]MDY3538375.1 hypothetical protein [Riemerella anatipestifer]